MSANIIEEAFATAPTSLVAVFVINKSISMRLKNETQDKIKNKSPLLNNN